MNFLFFLGTECVSCGSVVKNDLPAGENAAGRLKIENKLQRTLWIANRQGGDVCPVGKDGGQGTTEHTQHTKNSHEGPRKPFHTPYPVPLTSLLIFEFCT